MMLLRVYKLLACRGSFIMPLTLFLVMAGTAFSQDITRVSVDSSGIQGNGDSGNPSISADGRYVAFASGASNLVADDTNGRGDVFVHDRQTGETTRVSIDSSGNQGNGGSEKLSISADGRFIAFESFSDNLVVGDSNGLLDVFVHDRQTGETTRVSVDSSGNQGNGQSWNPSISADGRYVAFPSQATNLVAFATITTNVFVHDRQTGETTCVSVDSSGIQGNGGSNSPSISADGRYIAFMSAATNLVADDTNDSTDVFVHDRQTGETTRVSVDSSGNQGNSYSQFVAISADGRYVTFDSTATNLVADDTNGWNDVFVHDRQTGETIRVSVDSSGNQGNSYSFRPTISAEGRYVAFESKATNLIAGDTNGSYDVFVHDRQTGETTRLSVDSSGNQGTAESRHPSISSDGLHVAFSSAADNLVTGDSNLSSDVFVSDWISPFPVTLFSPNGGEFIPSGSVFIIVWEAIAEAETFSLKFSTDNGKTWKPIKGATGVRGTNFHWSVPNILKNKEHCLVRVTGYKADGTKVGLDNSDAPFTIGKVNLTAPSASGISLTSGDTYTITWTTHTADIIDTIKLFYTTNANADPITWKLITGFSEGDNPGTFTWKAPVVAKTKIKCKIKVVLKDSSNRIIGIDTSDNYFTVQPISY